MFQVNSENLMKIFCYSFVTFWTAFTINILYVRRKFQHIPGPKANGLLGFYMGNFMEIVRIIKSGKIFPDKLADWYSIVNFC